MPRPQSPGRTPAKTQQNQIVNSISTPSEHHPQQQLFPVAEVEFEGMTMGVLSDGTPYLHLRGLARLCGIDHSVLQRLSANWPEERLKPRGTKIQEVLFAQGHAADSLHFWTIGTFGDTHAYTDAVCMAILEYYAFEATQSSAGVALKNYRLPTRSERFTQWASGPRRFHIRTTAKTSRSPYAASGDSYKFRSEDAQ